MKSKRDAAVINTVLVCNRPGIDNMKLQKILYFAAARWAVENRGENERLLDEDFEVWKYGPVIPSAYDAFSKYGSGNIKEFVEHEGKRWVYEEEAEQYRCIQAISEIFRKHTGVDLSNISHAKGSPWEESKYKSVIKLGAIVDYFSEESRLPQLYT